MEIFCVFEFIDLALDFSHFLVVLFFVCTHFLFVTLYVLMLSSLFKGSWEKLLSSDVKSQELDSFLSAHCYLNWLHYIDIGDYSKVRLT